MTGDKHLPHSDIIRYQTEDGRNRIEVRLENEVVWLTQQFMAELLQTTIQNISLHLQNIYAPGELSREATVKDFLTVRREGARDVQRRLESYNLSQKLFGESGAGVPPANFREAAGTAAPHCKKAGQRPAPQLYIAGAPSILDRPKIALFCSVKCPGKIILDTYDLAKRLRDEGALVISPFHSPMEQECLRILLRSPTPIIWGLARGIYRQIPSKPVDCRPAVSEGRLVMLTPFPDNVRHITANTATIRNRLVADMASAVVIAHAAPGSKMEALCHDILAAGKPLYTFDHPTNATLLQAGARIIGQLDVSAFAQSNVKPNG